MSLSNNSPKSAQAYDNFTTISVLQSLLFTIALCIGIWALIYATIAFM